jgi:hypothetical protein
MTGRQILCSLITATGRDRCRHVTYAKDLSRRTEQDCTDHLDALLDELVGLIITASDDAAGDETIVRGGLLSSIACRRRSGDLLVEFALTPLACAAFGPENPYCAENTAAALQFTSKYAPALLRLAREGLERGAEPTYLSQAKLRASLGVDDDKYLNWTDFRRFVLDPAAAEVNAVAHLDIGATEVRQARKVVGVELLFSAKPWFRDIDRLTLRGMA